MSFQIGLSKPRGWHWRRSVKKINEMERRKYLLFERGTSEFRDFQRKELIFSEVSTALNFCYFWFKPKVKRKKEKVFDLFCYFQSVIGIILYFCSFVLFPEKKFWKNTDKYRATHTKKNSENNHRG